MEAGKARRKRGKRRKNEKVAENVRGVIKIGRKTQKTVVFHRLILYISYVLYYVFIYFIFIKIKIYPSVH